MTLTTQYLTATKFSISIPDDEDGSSYREIQSNITDWPHPAITRASADAPGRTQNVPYQGGRISYEPLSISLHIDSALNTYKLLHDLLLSDTQKDVTLTCYSGNGKPLSKIVYEGAFPEYLGQMSFQTTDQSETIIVLQVTFKYTKFTPK